MNLCLCEPFEVQLLSEIMKATSTKNTYPEYFQGLLAATSNEGLIKNSFNLEVQAEEFFS